MSTRRDYEATVRAALHAAADSLEPRDDGLERIRARLRQPRHRSSPAWAQAASIEFARQAPTWLKDVVYQLAEWARLGAGWVRLGAERFRPAPTAGRHRSRTQGLLRPLAAMAVVMFIVAAGTYVAIDASTGIFPSSSSNAPTGGGPNTGGHTGAPSPHPSHVGESQSTLGTGTHTPVANASCSATPKAGQSTSSAPPPSQSASPSPDASSPTDTSSPSPSDSSTTSVAPASPAASSAPPANPPTTQTATTPPLTKPGC